MNSRSTCEARLELLQKLLAIRPVGLRDSLYAGSSAIAELFSADKVDAMMFEESGASLVALATTGSPMAQRQREIGMDRQPIANGGRAAQVFTTGKSFLSDDVQNDPEELVGVKALGARSQMAVAFDVAGRRAGVLTVISAKPAVWNEADLRFFETVASWLATVAEHAQSTEQMLDLAYDRARRLAAGDLIAAVAHDVGNHLAAVRLRLALLEGNQAVSTDPAAAQALASCIAAVQWVAQLTADLLDAERLDSGQFKLVTTSVDLCQTARDAAGVWSAGTTNLSITCQGRTTVIGDASRLRQAVDNLIANAVRHSTRGGRVQVLVRSAVRDAVEHVEVIVQDDGTGLEPALLSRIGQKFTTGTRSAGAGLGLYIVQSIAAAHGGALGVDSPPGAGAQFRLSIPVIPRSAFPHHP